MSFSLQKLIPNSNIAMPSTKMKIKSIDETESFELTDKVEYEDFIRENIPEEIIFPEELNRFLRDQIRELRSENGCLRRSVNELEEKLLTLGKSSSKTDETPFQLPESTSSGILKSIEITAASKIVDLSKKCREQTSEIEVLKSKCKKLESKLPKINKTEEIKSCKDNSVNEIDNSHPLTIENELKNRDEEIKILREKIHQINSKLYDSKNMCTSLRQELNKAQKLLCKEIGESVTISGLYSREKLNGWRGRAEQIKQLQNKLMEYEGTSSKGSISNSSLEKRRNSANLIKIEKERREKSENLNQELRQISEDFESCKRKRDAAKARIKVLENDLASTKQSIAIFNEKRSHDEQLIEALNGQLKSIEDRYKDKEREIIIVKEKGENECMKFCSEVNRLQLINENLQKTLEERETEIDSLRSGNIASFGRDKNMSKSSPSSRGNKIEFCSNGDYNEYVTLGIAAEAERERLLELVIVLNRRLDEERFATDKIGETLRGERSKLARLETKLQRLEMERVGMSRINTGYKPRFSKSKIFCESRGPEGDSSREETRFRLELLEEECLALKTRLATVQRDKASDLTVYKQMLDQARKTFQEAYRGKPNSSTYSTVTI